jgi:hypothetical protein
LWRKIDSILTHPVCGRSLTGIAVHSEWARSATGEKERKKEKGETKYSCMWIALCLMLACIAI